MHYVRCDEWKPHLTDTLTYNSCELSCISVKAFTVLQTA